MGKTTLSWTRTGIAIGAPLTEVPLATMPSVVPRRKRWSVRLQDVPGICVWDHAR